MMRDASYEKPTGSNADLKENADAWGKLRVSNADNPVDSDVEELVALGEVVADVVVEATVADAVVEGAPADEQRGVLRGRRADGPAAWHREIAAAKPCSSDTKS